MRGFPISNMIYKWHFLFTWSYKSCINGSCYKYWCHFNSDKTQTCCSILCHHRPVVKANYHSQGVLIEYANFLLDCPSPKWVFVFLIVYKVWVVKVFIWENTYLLFDLKLLILLSYAPGKWDVIQHKQIEITCTESNNLSVIRCEVGNLYGGGTGQSEMSTGKIWIDQWNASIWIMSDTKTFSLSINFHLHINNWRKIE